MENDQEAIEVTAANPENSEATEKTESISGYTSVLQILALPLLGTTVLVAVDRKSE